METTVKRNISNGLEYDHLFPEATGVIRTIKSNATVGDTIDFIKKVVPDTLQQTKSIANELKGRSVYETCNNVWSFVYRHIRYKKDKDGYEQIRSPRRSWLDRKSGVDCDCYSTFISSILCNLRIPHKLRITKYGKDYFQHIYPVVPDGRGFITLDCVTEKFDHEVPYTEKKDVTMDLQYLDGLGVLKPYSSKDDQIIDGYNEFGDLGLFGKRKKKKQGDAAADPLKNPDAVPATGGAKKKKGFFKKVLNVANKINPVTLALRNGILAAMKLNIAKIGSRLRWSYLSPNAAKAKGIDMDGYAKLVKTRQKLENIFYNAGGNPANMKKAILKGKGNKDHVVSGLLGLGAIGPDDSIGYMNIYTPLPQLLGDIYYDENIRGMEGFEGFGELGEPATIASVTAAASVIAAIASSLKKIGDIFKGKKTEGSEDFSEAVTSTAENDVNAVKNVSASTSSNNSEVTTTSNSDDSVSEQTEPTESSSEQSVSINEDSSNNAIVNASTSIAKSQIANKTTAKNTTGFWANNKKWIIPAGIGVAVVGIGIKMMAHPSASPKAKRTSSLNGTPKNKNIPQNKNKAKGKKPKRRGRKAPIALM